MMGAVAMHRHDASEALPYFEKYVRLQPDDPRGRFALGVARFLSQQFDEARADLERGRAASRDGSGRALLPRAHRAPVERPADREARARGDARAERQVADAWAELGLVQTARGEYAGRGAVAQQGALARSEPLPGDRESHGALRQDEGPAARSDRRAGRDPAEEARERARRTSCGSSRSCLRRVDTPCTC